MKKLYGSINNRLEENKLFVKEIKVGDGATEYSWSDRTPFEVIEVIDQQHFFIREMDYKRINVENDTYMSENQEYEYISNKNNEVKEIIIKNNQFKEVYRYNKERLDKQTQVLESDTEKGKFITFLPPWFRLLTEKEQEKIRNGKEVKKYKNISLSVGVMERYYDYSF